ncbi:acyl-CoA dehydrogenase family protein [Novosphingobium colocasiae]
MALQDPSETGFSIRDGPRSARARSGIATAPRQKNASAHEELGELKPEVIAALDEAGLFRMSAPRRWGGLCIPSEAMANVSRELAKGCPSTAWVVSIINSCVWIASTMAPSMQEVIFADGVPRICGPSNGAGTIEQRDGKYVVNGKWAYGSASHHAKWAMVPAAGENGQMNMVLLPMDKVEIEQTWRVTGMKGTGSDTVVALDIEVGADQFL